MRRLAWYAIALLAGHPVWAGETCRWTGTTSYSGRADVEAKSTTARGETTIDVTARVAARSFGVISWQYLYQEIGIWRNGALRQVAVNHRYSVAGVVRRQQWDVFDRSPSGMIAWRAQAKTLSDFQVKHPGFVDHWGLASFGEPWLADYPAARPERRADLDLTADAMPPDLGTPLALAFHWIRWAGQESRTVPVFLPGFKHDKRTDIRTVSLGIGAGGLLHLRAEVRYPGLSKTEPSTGDAWISTDHRLVRAEFDARSDRGNAQGALRLDACTGDPSTP
jgi:hypothetical protein